jgi:GH24 family phage-related lysozyme (muramidase)
MNQEKKISYAFFINTKMGVTRNTTSFKDFYYLEENLQEDLINKWNQLKDAISNSNTLSIDNLKRQIKSIVLELKNRKSELLKNFLKLLVDDLFTKKIFSNPIKNRSLIAWLLGVLVLAGVSTLRNQQETPALVDYSEVKAAVDEVKTAADNGAFNTPVTPEKTEKMNKAVSEQIRWGTFKNRKEFVDQVKKYESDSGNPLAAYFDRTQTSIGFGTKAKQGESALTPVTAHNRLIDELEEHEKLVHNIIRLHKPKWKLNQNQWNSLIDISFNIGSGELTKMLDNSKTLKDLGKRISNVTYATKKDGTKVESPSLIKRRAWENALLGNPPIVKSVKK